MLRYAAIALLVTSGCNSEAGLGTKGDPNAHGYDTALGPDPGEGGGDTDDPYWGPNTDSFYTTGEEPPWIWDSGETTPDGGTTPGGETTPDGGTVPGGGTGTPSDPGTPGDPGTPTDTGVPVITPDDTGFTDDEICEAAAAGLAGYLDPWQTPGDGRVYYCHNSSGSNWTFVESDISSCLPHLNHNFDVFPTTGCDS